MTAANTARVHAACSKETDDIRVKGFRADA
jgi:hypothetical protein